MANERILATGAIVAGGEVDWRIAPLPVDFVPHAKEDGELQRLIDEAEMTAELEDYLADVDWLRGGC
jgi:hypothetical protein